MNLMDELDAIAEATADSVEGIEIDLRADLARFILNHLKDSGMTQKELAKNLRMGEPLLSRILALDANATMRTIARLYKTFGEKPAIIAKVSAHKAENARTRTIGVVGRPSYYPNSQGQWSYQPGFFTGAIASNG